MPSRQKNEQKNFLGRRLGLARKCNDMKRLYGVRAALLIEDGSDVFIYQSEENWPPAFDHILADRKFPGDFTTLRQHLSASTSAETTPELLPTSSPPQALDLEGDYFSLVQDFCTQDVQVVVPNYQPAPDPKQSSFISLVQNPSHNSFAQFCPDTQASSLDLHPTRTAVPPPETGSLRSTQQVSKTATWASPQSKSNPSSRTRVTRSKSSPRSALVKKRAPGSKGLYNF
ncbi:hypothetical protein EG329_003767 [Mollisiaceae sp. DMI_Dod_QoI]|nr:hypothetical protein EG329_003767 [Helotiales sp. DMI_Dod_QoI]